jgi:SAM-dependent methyltransferase
MLRDLVPMSIRQRLWEDRMLRRAPPATRNDVERLFADIAHTIDCERLRRLFAAHRDAPFDLAEACDHERKLRIAIVKAFVMGLHGGPPLRVLDLGHGGGYFVTVARRLGHTCDGTEVPADRLPPRAAALYEEITAALGYQDQQRVLVERFRPLGIAGNYDVICAHKICFNDHGKPSEWTVPEWRFFIEDARRLLAPGGRLVLELNENRARFGALRWYDAPLRAYFRSVGTVDDHWITVR